MKKYLFMFLTTFMFTSFVNAAWRDCEVYVRGSSNFLAKFEVEARNRSQAIGRSTVNSREVP